MLHIHVHHPLADVDAAPPSVHDRDSLDAIHPDRTLVEDVTGSGPLSYAATKSLSESSPATLTPNAVRPSQDNVNLEQASRLPEHPMVVANDDPSAAEEGPHGAVSSVGSGHGAHGFPVPLEQTYGMVLDPVDRSTTQDIPESFVPFTHCQPEPIDAQQSSDASRNCTQASAEVSEGCMTSSHATISTPLPPDPALPPLEMVHVCLCR